MHHKQNDTDGEDVDFLALVSPAKVLLWGHVAVGSQSGLEEPRSVSALRGCCQSKIDDLDVPLLIKHDVLWLEIPVGHAAAVAVADGINDLSEVVSAQVLLEPSCLRNEVEKFSTSGKLDDDVCDQFLTVLLDVLLLVVVVQLYYVGVLADGLESIDLREDGLHCLLAQVGLQDFDGYSLASLHVDSQFGLGEGARSECLLDVILPDLLGLEFRCGAHTGGLCTLALGEGGLLALFELLDLRMVGS